MNRMALRPLVFFLMASSALVRSQDAASANDAENKRSKPLLDMLVIAPHPDDEVIGCAGVMLQALEQQKHVGVVILTNGDGYPALAAAAAKKDRDQLTPEDFIKAGALRQTHSLRAMQRLGLPKEELVFLGYPDSGLQKISRLDDSTPFRQMFTQKRETYGVAVPDYHTSTHGKPAPYLKSYLVGDLVEIIRKRQPKEVYVTHETDRHGDHSAAFGLVREALKSAGFQGRLLTYVVHGKPPPQPPDVRLKLTPAQHETKRAAIIDHQAGTSPVHDRLVDEYLKREEIFWQFPIP